MKEDACNRSGCSGRLCIKYKVELDTREVPESFFWKIPQKDRGRLEPRGLSLRTGSPCGDCLPFIGRAVTISRVENNGFPYGGDWRLVALLVFKTSAGPRRSWVGSIPIRLRHFANEIRGRTTGVLDDRRNQARPQL